MSTASEEVRRRSKKTTSSLRMFCLATLVIVRFVALSCIVALMWQQSVFPLTGSIHHRFLLLPPLSTTLSHIAPSEQAAATTSFLQEEQPLEINDTRANLKKTSDTFIVDQLQICHACLVFSINLLTR